MKDRQQTLEAIRQLNLARRGASKAVAPVPPGTVIETADAKAERHAQLLKDENYQRVVILGRMIDALRWSIGEPSELAEWMEKFEKVDRIEQLGFAGRVA